MTQLIGASVGLGAFLTAAGLWYVCVVLTRIASGGPTHLGGDIIRLVYVTLVGAILFLVPGLSRAPGRIRVGARVAAALCAAGLICWAALTFGGVIVSHESMTEGR